MIKLEGITKSFGSLQVLKGIDLEINKGEIVSIVGPSGAGKTTLLQIMGTLDEPDAGTVQIDGTVVSRMKEKELSAFRNKNIGFVFQFHQLLPEFTALENVMIPGLIAGVSSKEANDRATKILASLVFCIFNFRPKGKAKCFAGDVGSIGIAFIILFLLGNVMIRTTDITWLIFLLVYGVDGCLTIVHRIMLHENLGEAHRKHAYQIMANELKVGHVKVSLLYTVMQLVISLGFIYFCPDTVFAH